jgi:DNA-directed RNA polymerase subunit H (RpoH/RPB5)
MSDALYQIYLNIQKFITQYRKYDILDGNLANQVEFNKIILDEHYIKCNCLDPQTQKKVYVILLKRDSKYIKSTANFKKLMVGLGKEESDVIVISKEPLSIYVKKLLPKLSNLVIYNYLHRHFAIEIPKGPLCSKHTILTQSEIEHLCSKELMIHPLGLPSILVTDPQCIWIGAKVGQVVKIEAFSEITGKTIRYRIVVPSVDIYDQADTSEAVEYVNIESKEPMEV